MLSQLVYVSNRKQNCTEKEIDKILGSCKKNNPPLNITGVLLYSEAKFIQLVEGEAKVILDLYDKIKKDSRHSTPILISYGPIREKAFPNWHMGSKDISKNEVEFKNDITSEEKVVFNNILSSKEDNDQKVLNLLKTFF